MENRKAQSGVREFCTVLGIAVAIAGTMTLLALVPPVSLLYRWFQDHDLPHAWTGLMAGTIGGVLSFYRTKQKQLQTAAAEE